MVSKTTVITTSKFSFVHFGASPRLRPLGVETLLRQEIEEVRVFTEPQNFDLFSAELELPVKY